MPGALCFLLQISAHDLNNVVRGFLGRLGSARHMIADMVLEKFTHQAVDCPARGRQTLEDLRARRVLLQGALDRRELPHDFLRAI